MRPRSELLGGQQRQLYNCAPIHGGSPCNLTASIGFRPSARVGVGAFLPHGRAGWCSRHSSGCSRQVPSSFRSGLRLFFIMLMSSCLSRCLSACVGSLASRRAGGGATTNAPSKSAHVDTIERRSLPSHANNIRMLQSLERHGGDLPAQALLRLRRGGRGDEKKTLPLCGGGSMAGIGPVIRRPAVCAAQRQSSRDMPALHRTHHPDDIGQLSPGLSRHHQRPPRRAPTMPECQLV
jgi:hypothetical protein